MLELYMGGFFVLFGLLMANASYKKFSRKRQIDSAERTPAAEVSSGLVQIQGTAEPIEPVSDPMYGDEAVLVDWQLRDRAGGGEHENYVLSGREQAVFEVADESGNVRVDPLGSDLTVVEENATREQFQANDPEIDRLRERTDASAGSDSSEPRWYDRNIVRPGEEVFVFGTATRDEDGPIVGMDPGDKSGVVVGGGETFVISTRGEPDVSADFGASTWLLAAISIAITAIGAYVILIGGG